MYNPIPPINAPVPPNAVTKFAIPVYLACKAPASPPAANAPAELTLPVTNSTKSSKTPMYIPNLPKWRLCRLRKRLYPQKCYLSWELVERFVSMFIEELNSKELMNMASTAPNTQLPPVIIKSFNAILGVERAVYFSVNDELRLNFSSNNTSLFWKTLE